MESLAEEQDWKTVDAIGQKGPVHYVSKLLLCVDGKLQEFENRIAITRALNSPLRVEVTYLIDAQHGFEFDPRKEVGSGVEHRVLVVGVSKGRTGTTRANIAFAMNARVVGWGVGDGKDGVVEACVCFEAVKEMDCE